MSSLMVNNIVHTENLVIGLMPGSKGVLQNELQGYVAHLNTDSVQGNAIKRRY